MKGTSKKREDKNNSKNKTQELQPQRNRDWHRQTSEYSWAKLNKLWRRTKLNRWQMAVHQTQRVTKLSRETKLNLCAEGR